MESPEAVQWLLDDSIAVGNCKKKTGGVICSCKFRSRIICSRIEKRESHGESERGQPAVFLGKSRAGCEWCEKNKVNS